MPETFHHIEYHALQGPHAEQRQTALTILIRKMNQLEAEINETKKTNPTKANLLVNELEAIIVQAEKIVADKALIDEVEQVIENGQVKLISGITPEGQEVKFELKEQLEYWRKFYEESGVDWVSLPNEISVSPEQAAEMQRLITKLGFDKMIIIPDGLVGRPEIEKCVDEYGNPQRRLKTQSAHYKELHQKMIAGYEVTYRGNDYRKDGGFGGSSDKRSGLRIVLTKDVQNLEDDALFKKTLGKSVVDLEAEVGILKEKGVTGFAESEYLVFQREYFKRTKKHLDEKGCTWLLGSLRLLFARVACASWLPSDGGGLEVLSDGAGYRTVNLGCRLAGSFPVIQI